MKQLTSTVLAGLHTQGTLIHREPEGDYDPDEPWWQETHWLIENGKITGIKMSVKCSQDSQANHHLVRFKQRGKTFELIGVEKIDNTPPFVNAEVDLPPTAPWILAPTPYLDPERNKAPPQRTDKWPVEGDSLFVFSTEKGATCRAFNYDDYSRDRLCQSLTTPVVTLFNSAEDQYIQEVWVDFWDSEQWIKGDGLISEGHSEKFERVGSFSISGKSTVKYQFEGIWSIPREGRASYNGSPHNKRIHEAFPNPLRARWSFK